MKCNFKNFRGPISDRWDADVNWRDCFGADRFAQTRF